MAAEQPIIIKKKKSGHGGHHGGAWKVAYADFVTALMALFIVLWLMSSTSKKTQEEISGYFRDPNGTSTKHGSDLKGPGEKPTQPDDMAKLKSELIQAIQQVDKLNKLMKQIEITVTEEGLRIELIEDVKGTFFELGRPEPTPVLKELLQVLAGELKVLPNTISIEGHTDAQPYAHQAGYGNWELSSDRANVARHIMQESGIGARQVSQVRGFADQRLRKPLQPYDASNRRISLVVQSLEAKQKMDIAALQPPDAPAAGTTEAHKPDPVANTEAKPAEGKAPEVAAAKPTEAPPAVSATANVASSAASSAGALLQRVERIFKH